MKPTTILSLTVTATSTAAANTDIHAVADLIARAMDPATMDPTKVSVLSVLKTAMPTPTGTATDIVLPTGDVAPQWYKDLPADVIMLLAQMYPATPTATVVSQTAALAMNDFSSSIQDSTASQTMLTRTLELVPTPTTVLATAISTGPSDGSTVVSTGSLFGNTTNATLATGAPIGIPSQPGTSVGAKNAVGAGVWSVAMGVGIAAAFCLFA